MMKAGVIITGDGGILVVTKCSSFEDPDLVDALRGKGINKYIAFEVPLDLVEKQYGQHYSLTMHDRTQSDILRVVDVDGQRIFKNFPLKTFGRPVCRDEMLIHRKAA
jgi:hypothetical protein